MAHPIALLLAAIVLANALEPAVDLFERRLPEAAAVGLAYGLTVLAIGGLGWVIVPALLAQAGDVLAAAPALLIFYVVVQQLKTILLVPIIVRQQADIPPLLVSFALAAGTSVGGVIGAVVAPPLAGALRIVILRALTPPLRRWAEASRLGAAWAPRPNNPHDA